MNLYIDNMSMELKVYRGVPYSYYGSVLIIKRYTLHGDLIHWSCIYDSRKDEPTMFKHVLLDIKNKIEEFLGPKFYVTW